MIKNMLVYTVKRNEDDPKPIDADVLEEALNTVPAGDPEGATWRTIGFSDPLATIPDRKSFVGAAGATYMTAVIAERNLPAAVIREHALKKCAKIEEAEDRKVYNKEYAQLKDEVIMDLLPKAFIKRTVVPVVYIPLSDMLIVGTSSQKKSDDVLNTLRAALGSLPVVPRTYDAQFDQLFSRIADEDTWFFRFDGDIKGKDSHGKKYTLAGVAIDDTEVQELMSCCDTTEMSIGFTFNEEQLLTFKLTSTGIIKQLKMSGILTDRIDADSGSTDDDDDSFAARLDAALAIYSLTMRQLDAAFQVDLASATVEDADTAYDRVLRSMSITSVPGDLTLRVLGVSETRGETAEHLEDLLEPAYTEEEGDDEL